MRSAGQYALSDTIFVRRSELVWVGMICALLRFSLLLSLVGAMAAEGAQQSIAELLRQENSRGDEYLLGVLERSVVLVACSDQRCPRALRLSAQSAWTEQQLAALLTDTTFIPRATIPFAPSVVIGITHSASRSAELALRRWDGSRWSAPEVLPGVNSAGWDGQPALSPDRQWLIFASDRVGGWGGLDLYICRRMSDGSWSSPENLGPSVNTAADEGMPWFLPDGRLLFASRGYTAPPRWKLVVASRNGAGSWEREVVLPPPLNSESDDLTPLVLGDTLLLASNRPGGRGGYDLYAFPLCGPVRVDLHFPKRLPGQLTVYDGETPVLAFPALADTTFTTRAFRRLLLRYTLPCSPPTEVVLNTPCDFSRTILYRLALPPPSPLSEQRCFPLSVAQAPTAEHAWSQALLASFRLRPTPLASSALPPWQTPEVQATEAFLDSLVRFLFRWLEQQECLAQLDVELLLPGLPPSREELNRRAAEIVLASTPPSAEERRIVAAADLLVQLRSRLPPAPELRWRVLPAEEQSPDTLCIRLRLRVE
ncbi:hypothetical protein HRbin21_01162 [bacterium HR21]|nr:hypothetical protein HRbin21_01162 [bacterium HR21]